MRTDLYQLAAIEGTRSVEGSFGTWRWRWNDISRRTWARMWSERRSIGQPCRNAGRESMQSIASICGTPNASRVLMKLSWPAALLQHCGIPLAAAGTLSCASSLAQAVGWLGVFILPNSGGGSLGISSTTTFGAAAFLVDQTPPEKNHFPQSRSRRIRLAELHGM